MHQDQLKTPLGRIACFVGLALVLCCWASLVAAQAAALLILLATSASRQYDNIRATDPRRQGRGWSADALYRPLPDDDQPLAQRGCCNQRRERQGVGWVWHRERNPRLPGSGGGVLYPGGVDLSYHYLIYTPGLKREEAETHENRSTLV